ncbi:unnamed protein product [Caenorhabditis auriculariae]|uniref:TOG domain-containing protein n=1 Tax=Caenorhabditis auriculariae TaxID=2777116 RepID=A0A8S1HN39_9PELO|nr:unnamed protein product [Caenorhabditis auriculariae]
MSSDEIPAHYWKNLLKLSTSVQGETQEIPKVLDEESRKWLEDVMKSLVNNVDPERQLISIMSSLKCYAASAGDLSEDDVDKVLDLVDRLDMLLQCADLTKLFVSNCGLIVLEKFLKDCKDDEINVGFALIISTWAENNPIGQDILRKSPLFSLLLDIAVDQGKAKALRKSAITAVSATIRSHIPSFEDFLALNGHLKLAEIVRNEVELAGKTARTLTSISFTLNDDEKYRDSLKPTVCECYVELVNKNVPVDEIDYIREYISSSVEPSQVDENLRSQVLDCVNAELGREIEGDNIRVLQTLRRKFAIRQAG